MLISLIRGKGENYKEEESKGWFFFCIFDLSVVLASSTCAHGWEVACQ